MNCAFPLIVAHNGFDKNPVNSITSVIDGIIKGADYVEIDVRATKDNIAVLFHDEVLDTEKYGQMKIRDLTFAELKKIIKTDLTASQKYNGISTLQEAAAIAKEKGGLLNLDMKSGLSIDPTAKVINDLDMVDSVVISGCEFYEAEYFKDNYQDFQVMLNIPQNILMDKTQDDSEKADYICRQAVERSCCAININYRFLFDQILSAAKKRYIPISIWTLPHGHNFDPYMGENFFSITTVALTEAIESRKNTLTINRGE